MEKGVLGRLLKMLFREYRLHLVVVTVCVVIVAFASTIASIFMNKFLLMMERALQPNSGGWASIRDEVIANILLMVIIYALGWLASFLYTRLMAIVTQRFLNQTRKQMFAKMQTLPLRYFDTHPHGDVMSY